MNALAAMPAPPRRKIPKMERPRATAGGAYLAAGLIALAVHAAVIFGVQRPVGTVEPVEFSVEAGESSVEVSLVAALPAEKPVAEVPPEPESAPVEPPPPEPLPEPPPVLEKPPEMTLPEPMPAPKPVAPIQPKTEKTPPKPKPAARAARPVGDGSSPVPGNDAISARVTAGGGSAKPGYLRNPHPQYPEASRAAGHQGLVKLRVSVDAAGSPTAVEMVRSSGFPLLDERARSTVASRWKFKPAKIGGVAISSTVVIPIRFTLNR